MNGSNDSNAVSGRYRRSIGPLASVLLAVVLYVLSPTPLGYFLISHFPEKEDTIEDVMGPVYAPLEWLYVHNQTVEAFYDWYGDLFMRE